MVRLAATLGAPRDDARRCSAMARRDLSRAADQLDEVTSEMARRLAAASRAIARLRDRALSLALNGWVDEAHGLSARLEAMRAVAGGFVHRGKRQALSSLKECLAHAGLLAARARAAARGSAILGLVGGRPAVPPAAQLAATAVLARARADGRNWCAVRRASRSPRARTRARARSAGA